MSRFVALCSSWVLTAGLLVMSGYAAIRHDDCNVAVVDTTRHEVLNDGAKIHPVVKELNEKNVRIVVRAADATNLVDYTNEQIEQCRTWQGDGWGRYAVKPVRNDMVLLVISPITNTAILVSGDSYISTELAYRAPNIVSNMEHLFKERRYHTGTANALQEVNYSIQLSKVQYYEPTLGERLRDHARVFARIAAILAFTSLVILTLAIVSAFQKLRSKNRKDLDEAEEVDSDRKSEPEGLSSEDQAVSYAKQDQSQQIGEVKLGYDGELSIGMGSGIAMEFDGDIKVNGIELPKFRPQ